METVTLDHRRRNTLAVEYAFEGKLDAEVPAPDDPVTATMGWRVDINTSDGERREAISILSGSR
jgi:hypothetical protein